MKPRQLLLALFAVVTGCVVFEAPYLPPVPVNIDLREVDQSTLIPYRTLVVSDFKATSAPDEGKLKYVDAMTLAFVMSTPCTLRVSACTDANSSCFEARVDSFCYVARMSQTQSWLNPKHKGTIRHILAHEQTHFAIAEVAARRANMHIDEIRDRVTARAPGDTLALRRAEKRFQAELDRIGKEVSARNIEFDENTKNGQRFRRDELWSKRLQEELEETTRFAGTQAHR